MEDRMSRLETYLHLQGWIVAIGMLLALVYLAIYIGVRLWHVYQREMERAARLRESRAGLTRYRATRPA